MGQNATGGRAHYRHNERSCRWRSMQRRGSRRQRDTRMGHARRAPLPRRTTQHAGDTFATLRTRAIVGAGCCQAHYACARHLGSGMGLVSRSGGADDGQRRTSCPRIDEQLGKLNLSTKTA